MTKSHAFHVLMGLESKLMLALKNFLKKRPVWSAPHRCEYRQIWLKRLSLYYMCKPCLLDDIKQPLMYYTYGEWNNISSLESLTNENSRKSAANETCMDLTMGTTVCQWPVNT